MQFFFNPFMLSGGKSEACVQQVAFTHRKKKKISTKGYKKLE